MKKLFYLVSLIWALVVQSSLSQQDFSVEDIMSYPFTYGMTAAKTVDRVVWAMNEQGQRNLFVAEGPDFKVRQLTQYSGDEGQEFSSIQISANGEWIIYIRGGDFGSNWDDELTVNPNFLPTPPKVEIWSIPFGGGEPISHGEGINPAISPDGSRIAFVKNRQIHVSPTDSKEEPAKIFTARGNNSSPSWSADGTALAFVSYRGDHSFVGIYRSEDQPIEWVTPSFHRDANPVWSPDGNELAFIRRPGSGGSPGPILKDQHRPWTIRVYSLENKSSKSIWEAPRTVEGSPPSTHGRYNLQWGNGAITFLSYHDKWPHLYAIKDGEMEANLLTKGDYMAEYISLSPDGNWLTFAGNTGPDQLDIDRRHVVRVGIEGGEEVMTPGEGNEWTPYILSNGDHMAFISADAQRPPLPAIMNLQTKQIQLLGEDKIPSGFPTQQLVVPKQIIFGAPDGTPIHATMFSKDGGPERKPAIVYIHGGPPRQMLLGWHYSSYYSNAYALNQYLANQGFVVISVNYRLGIGYGYDFHRPVDGGTRGASEYQDIKAAGDWLANQPFVDPDRIGVYGGSYGGYLTAMALGRDSDLFAAGVDIHGVHDRINGRVERYKPADGYKFAPDVDEAIEVAWTSSPVADIGTWTSPVLIIHGDDDRNVDFSQSVDLVQRLEAQGVDLETLVIVDDTHHFMTLKNQKAVNEATAEFLIRKLNSDGK